MGILADIIVCAVILLCVLIGFSRGFIKSFIEFIGYFAAMIASVFLANVLSVFVYNTVLRDIMIKKISSAITDSAAMPVEQKVQAVLQTLPKFITNGMGEHGVTTQSLGKTLSASAASAAPKAADLMSPMVIGLTKVIFTVIIFVLLLMVIRLLAKAVNTVFKLPLLHEVNSLLGGVFGLLKGILVVLLLCSLLELTVPVTQVKSQEFMQQTLNSSFVFKTLYQNNPIYLLLGK